MKVEPFFRHLEISSRQNCKTAIRLAVKFDEVQNKRVRSGFIILETQGQKKHIIEGFEVAIKTEILPNVTIIEERKQNQQNLISVERDAKREQNQPELSLNRFFERKYEENYARKFIQRPGVEESQRKEEKFVPKKFKIQL